MAYHNGRGHGQQEQSQGMTTSYLVQLDPEVQRPGVRALARILGWGWGREEGRSEQWC